MKRGWKFGIIVWIGLAGGTLPVFSAKPKPVTPDALPQTQALLDYLYNISGKYTLTGQHNYPAAGDRNSRYAKMYIGRTPVIWSQDFGFAAAGDKDSYRARPALVQYAIREHTNGSLVTFCWHAAPPTADEPVTFRPKPGTEGQQPLASVQGRLTDQQFRDLLTPGTEIYNRWVHQVDDVAKYLKMLQDHQITVLWRPYHEMNGDWFWWGGRYEGEYTSAALYRQLFDRLVNVHKLRNLIWVWNVDRPTTPERAFKNFYPGDKYVDILSLDVYGSDFHPDYYRELLALAKHKPIALGEVGKPPSTEVLKEQPRWLYWVVWAGMVRNTSWKEYETYVKSPQVLFTEDPAYIDAINPYRQLCGLPWLLADLKADFSGNWKLNECESRFGKEGVADVPYQLNIRQEDTLIRIQGFTVVEWEGDIVHRETLTTDGTGKKSTTGHVETLRSASWSPLRDSLLIHTEKSFTSGGEQRRIVSDESWTLHRGGRILIIERSSTGPSGKSVVRWVYDKI